jgi:hypothetical protein
VAEAVGTALPEVVDHYLRRALGPTPRRIHTARLKQRGELRFDRKSRWARFEADEIARPDEVAFEWNARIVVGKFIRVSVRDAYRSGQAEARVRVLSLITIAHQRGGAQLNSGSLYRFLAEAPWYPTALLPSERLRWDAIDASRAQASLTDGQTQAALEFRFDAFGDVAGIYAAARPRKHRGGYDVAAWEGHFRDYREQDGLRVPAYGEVGWHDDGRWAPVWKATLIEAAYEFSSVPLERK